MTFSSGGKFQGGRVQRGASGRTGVAVGGIGGLAVIALVVLLSGGNLGDVFNAIGGTSGLTGSVQPGDAQTGWVEECTAEEANTDRQCRLNATVQSLDAYWTEALPDQAGVKYTEPPVVSFDGTASTPCGTASSSTGPFYCPSDQTIYIDVSFYDELQQEFGAEGGPLAEEYVVAHEMGHHIENLTGALEEASGSGTGAESDSVRIELMADCLAGMWAGAAATTVDPDTGVTFLEPITDQQLAEALDAAAAIGDDKIQEEMQGKADPDSFTHGTSAQRVKWFKVGYTKGTLAACNTLDADSL
ncbi:MAG: neutral zinc metallopeptidase [Bifidobacteriaceae bacterium]|jgi:predicted metalloprotease|nr:neutral zinc metallopeptidase [Bifidobacteriaceae bacterium]